MRLTFVPTHGDGLAQIVSPGPHDASHSVPTWRQKRLTVPPRVYRSGAETGESELP
jgi:hypothetical protein